MESKPRHRWASTVLVQLPIQCCTLPRSLFYPDLCFAYLWPHRGALTTPLKALCGHGMSNRQLANLGVGMDKMSRQCYCKLLWAARSAAFLRNVVHLCVRQIWVCMHCLSKCKRHRQREQAVPHGVFLRVSCCHVRIAAFSKGMRHVRLKQCVHSPLHKVLTASSVNPPPCNAHFCFSMMVLFQDSGHGSNGGCK